MTPSQAGFYVEQLIHDAVKPYVSGCYRECDIREKFGASFNGVDHWITHENRHILAQTKWTSDPVPQQKITQFLDCSRRIRDVILRENPSSIVYFVLITKMPPTRHSIVNLQENSCSVVLQGGSMMDLVNDSIALISGKLQVVIPCMNGIEPECVIGDSTSITTAVAVPVPVSIPFDETEAGKIRLRNLESTIQQIIGAVERKTCQFTDVLDRDFIRRIIPDTIEKWRGIRKIDVDKGLKELKKKYPMNRKMSIEEITSLARIYGITNVVCMFLEHYRRQINEMNEAGSVAVKQYPFDIRCTNLDYLLPILTKKTERESMPGMTPYRNPAMNVRSAYYS
jgi:hypothetical protein